MGRAGNIAARSRLQILRSQAYNCGMAHFRLMCLYVLLGLSVLASACGGSGTSNGPVSGVQGNTNSHTSRAPRTNVEELRLLVNVPYDVEDVAWKEDTASKSLIAVLRFSPTDSDKIVAEAERSGAPQAGVISPEAWFPDELIAQSAMSGDNILKGLSYSAAAFLHEPYSAGKLTRIDDTDYFILEASSK